MLWNHCKDKWPSHNDLGNRAVPGDFFAAENIFMAIWTFCGHPKTGCVFNLYFAKKLFNKVGLEGRKWK